MNAAVPSARALFLEALDRHSPAQWPEFLDSACGTDAELRRRVERLLAAHQAGGGFMDRPAAEPLATADFPPDAPGMQIGRYKLLELLGEGGMGVVYVAEQTEPVRRQVALKLIKPGMDSRQVIARFEAERQALALMDHPNIARILDAGCIGEPGVLAPGGPPPARAGGSPGRPYFVMELVRGLPITEFCDHKQLGLRERLQLFITVCQAVQHAHQKGIIHRDLKPSNVLVTLQDGQPLAKIIDFGVAKAISPLPLGQDEGARLTVTSISHLIGTPLYMSPEQAELGNQDIDTRSDVYSLGVLLYELLTGTTPVGKERLESAGFDELRRIIREEEPETVSRRLARTRRVGPAPGTTAERWSASAGPPNKERASQRRWAGAALVPPYAELDWIALKALEKDRNRRYESASALAADVQRYLADEPIQAAPPSPLYLAKKLVRRHRWAAASAALAFSLLALGLAATLWQAVRARNAEQSAEQRFELAKEAVDKYLLEVTQDEQLASPAFQELRRKLLEAAEPFYERLSRERPADPRQKSQQAAALHRLGQVHMEIGKYPLANQAFERAAGIYEELIQSDPHVFSRDQTWSRSPAASLGSQLHVYELTSVLLSRGNLWCRQGENDKAVPCYERSLALRQSLHLAAPADPDLAHALAEAQLRLGSIQRNDQGRRNLADATQLLTLVSAQHPQSTAYQESLARSHQEWASHLEVEFEQAAQQHHEAAVAIYTSLVAANVHSVKWQIALAVAQALHGDTFDRIHHLQESRKCRLQAVEGLARLAAQHPGRVDVEVQLGRIMVQLGKNEEDLWLDRGPAARFTLRDIQQRYAAALEIHERLASRFPHVADFQVHRAGTQAKVAEILSFRGQTDEAIPLLAGSQEQLRQVQQETGGDARAREFLASAHARLAEIHVREGMRREADREWAAAKALGVSGNEFAARFVKVDRALASFSAGDEFRELLRQTGGFLASVSGGQYLGNFSAGNLRASLQDFDMKRWASCFRLPRLGRSLLNRLGHRQRRLNLEKLEDRSLLASIYIGDVAAMEGNTVIELLDAFVATGSGGLNAPKALDFHEGDLFVTSGNSDSVLRYGPSGNLLGEFVTPQSGGLDNPFDLTFGPDGMLYVTSWGTHEVLRYDGMTGAFDSVFVTTGSGGLMHPRGMVFGAEGSLYVASQDSGQVLKYQGPSGQSPGAFVGEFANTGDGLHWPFGLVFGPDGDMYVSVVPHDSNNGELGIGYVNRYDGSTGSLRGTFVPTGAGGLKDPRDIAFDTEGNLFVPDDKGNNVLRFQGPNGVTPGAFLDEYVSSGSGGLDSPIGITFGTDGNLYVASRDTHQVLRYGSASQARFTVNLSSPSASAVTVDYASTDGTIDPKAIAGIDFVAASGTVTFGTGETSKTILVKTIDDSSIEPNKSFSLILSNPTGASIADDTGVGTIIDNDTKFYVVDDAATNATFEYGSFADGGGAGAGGESYGLQAGNTAPRGAASTAAGDKVWVVDANRNVYVYDAAGVLLGSWTATASGLAQPEGIATNGTDIWIVDASADKVFKFAGAASRLTGTQNSPNNASFKLNNSNKDASDIVTDGASLWVVNNASGSNPDKVFKYNLNGILQGSWTILGGGGSPTGITLDPASPSHLWIVDNATDRVYQFDGATSRTSGSQSPSTSFALAAGNLNPQGIADPPASGATRPASFDAALMSLLDDLDPHSHRLRRR